MNPKLFEEKRRIALLRNAAEAQLAGQPELEAPTRPVGELLQELRVHQIELEMQNEELRRAQVALEESRDRYVDLYDFAPVGYATLTRDGLIDEINLTGAALLGMERKKLMQRRFASYVAPEDGDRWHRHFMHTLQCGDKQCCELAMVRADGTRFHAGLDCLYMVDGESAAVRIAFSDISERWHAEEQFRHLNETLEQRVQEETAKNMVHERLLIQQSRLAAMGEMIGNIAHQWRQPLNTLGLVVQNIQVDYRDHLLGEEALKNYVATAMQAIEHMSCTIDDFRNFFKPNKEKQLFLVCDAVADAIKLLGSSFANNRIEIALDRGDESCAVYGHPSEFAQVMVNVLGNAKDAILGKKVAGKIRVAVNNEGGAVAVAIHNNGGNIPGEILDKVFDPYFTTKDCGTGIGLYMSKMIMSHMGGDIAIRNVEDGVEVLLHLPLVDAGRVAAQS